MEKDTFRIRDKSLGRYRKSLPKEGISLYNDSDYNRKVTIRSPISIPLTLHLDVASRHMKRKKTAHSCKHDSQFASISHGSESLHMKKKTIRRSEDSNTTEEGDSVDHDGSVFPLRHHGPLSGSPARYGMLGGADDSVRHRNGRNANRVDLRHFPAAPLAVCAVHFVSGIVDHHDYPAGDLLSDCAEESPQPGSSRIKKRKKTKSQKNRG